MHRSTASHNPYNLFILTIVYSKHLPTSYLRTIEHITMFVVKSIHIQINSHVMDLSIARRSMTASRAWHLLSINPLTGGCFARRYILQYFLSKFRRARVCILIDCSQSWLDGSWKAEAKVTFPFVIFHTLYFINFL